MKRLIIAILALAQLWIVLSLNRAVSAQIKVGSGGSIVVGQSSSYTAPGIWQALQTFLVGIQLANNTAISAENSAGTPASILNTDVSNNINLGDTNDNFSGNLIIWAATGTPAITISNTTMAFGLNPAIPAFTLNGSQTINGVQGSSASKVALWTGSATHLDCVNVATDGSLQDAGAACGASGGVVTAVTTNGTSGAATLISGTLNIPVYTSTNIANVTLALPAGLSAAATTCYRWSGSVWGAAPATPATITMTGVVTTPVPSFIGWGWQGSPYLTNGWGAVGGLTLNLWPSAANTVSWEVCNQTPNSISSGTPSFTISAK